MTVDVVVDSNGNEYFVTRGSDSTEITIPDGYEAVIKRNKIIFQKKESEDEKIRKKIVACFKAITKCDEIERQKILNWLEKQKNSVPNAKYVDDVAKSFVDGGKACALSFIEFLNKNRYEGKMCVSNPECADIDKAFVEKDWAKLIAYANKYIGDKDRAKEKLSIKPKQQWSKETLDEFTNNIRTLIIDKLTTKTKGSNGSEISSTVFIDDKTAKDIVNGILFYVGKEVMKNPNREIPAWTEEDEKTLEGIINYLRKEQYYDSRLMFEDEIAWLIRKKEILTQKEL